MASAISFQYLPPEGRHLVTVIKCTYSLSEKNNEAMFASQTLGQTGDNSPGMYIPAIKYVVLISKYTPHKPPWSSVTKVAPVWSTDPYVLCLKKNTGDIQTYKQ